MGLLTTGWDALPLRLGEPLKSLKLIFRGGGTVLLGGRMGGPACKEAGNDSDRSGCEIPRGEGAGTERWLCGRELIGGECERCDE